MNRNIQDVLALGSAPMERIIDNRNALVNERKKNPRTLVLRFEALYDVCIRQQAEIDALWAIVVRVAHAADVRISHQLPLVLTDEEPELEDETGDYDLNFPS